MRLLAPFDPYLTGSVLSGTAGRYGDIHLQLYTDSLKELEIFQHNRDIPFRNREIRVWTGDSTEMVPIWSLRAASRDPPHVLAPVHRVSLALVLRRKTARARIDPGRGTLIADPSMPSCHRPDLNVAPCPPFPDCLGCPSAQLRIPTQIRSARLRASTEKSSQQRMPIRTTARQNRTIRAIWSSRTSRSPMCCAGWHAPGRWSLRI